MNRILILLFLLTVGLVSAGQVNLNLGLKAYYPFSGNANDVSGNGYNGNPQGGIQLTSDRFGNPNSAYLFDGIDDRIIVSDNGGFSTPAFSICYYFMTQATGVYQNCIGKINYTDGNAATYNSGIMNTGEAYFGTIASPGTCFTQVPSTLVYTIFSPSAIQPNQWYCVVNTFENGVEKMYLNGVLVKQSTVPFNNATQCTNTNFIIGSWWQNDPVRFNGKIDDVRFYNRAINADEVNALCVTSNTVSCTNWLRTQAVGQSVTVGDLDISGNQMTIEANFNCSSFPINRPDKWEDIVSKHANTTDANYVLRMDLAAITTTTGHYLLSPGCDNLVLNKTFHVALVYDGTTLKFYRNGFLMGQMPVTGNLILNNWPTTIGDYAVNNPVGTNFLGYINEVRIWNVARSQSQLQTYMNASLPNPTTTPGLLGYYTFDNLLNKQGNPAYNGTLNGGASINNTNPNCVFSADSCSVTSNISTVINTYTPVLALNPCDNKLTVQDGSTFNVGDTVLMIQMKGAVIDSTNTAAFGNVTDYKNAGNYEFNYVKSRTGNVIELKNKLLRQYDIPLGKVQLIRVPYFNSVNITDTLTCLPWDGSKGGVLVLNVRDTVTMNKDINVSGKGFRGGIALNSHINNYQAFCGTQTYYSASTATARQEKGEGIAEVSAQKMSGRGPLANGGGGGNMINTGGGGGSNSAIGGKGGDQYEECVATPNNVGGLPGKGLSYSAAVNKIFMGGGGGAGDANDPGSPYNPDGGNGGAIAIIKAGFLKTNGFSIISNGNDGKTCTANCEEGMGGGGAGGTILLNVSNFISATNNIISKGGKGTDNTPHNGIFSHGPGGGGSGGVVFLSNPSLPASIITNLAGGLNGLSQTAPPVAWGAQPGNAGQTVFNLQLLFTSVVFTPNIDSVRIKDSLISCKNYDFKGLAYVNTNPISQWQWDFGDGGTANTQNATHAYSTGGTYNVKLVVTDINGCKDSIFKPVIVLNCTGNSIIINTYTPVLALNPCDNKITVEDASTFNVGDTVLMIQMKGAVIDSSNTAAFGSISSYNNAGNYEFNYVRSKAGNVIELLNKLTRQYDIPVGKVQLVRVPYYNGSVTISDTLTCLPWDGNKGGILAFNVKDTVNMNADINVSGKGFKGGVGYNPGNASLTCFQNNYYYPPNTINAAQKGESIATISSAKSCGKGNLAAGGGGGAGHNSGGGGGGNGGIGGFGGYQLEPCGSAPYNNRGIGGIQPAYSTAANRIFMGSGGGAGHADNPGNIPPGGGNGAGIIIINADKIVSNNKKITANGANAVVCTMPSSPDCHDGMGGGGAGGTVLLSINQLNDNSVVEVKGGRGSDVIGGPIAAAGRIGPGGGGGGGLTFVKGAALPANLTVTNTGGANGVMTQDANNPWGATPGAAGINLFNLVLPVDNVLFTPNIDSVRIKDSLLNCNGFDFKGLAYVNTNPISTWFWDFGDGNTANTQNTSHAYGAAGTYTVKLVVTDINGCKDSVTKPVTALPGIVADAGQDTAYCSNGTITHTLQGSGVGTYSWTPAIYLNNPNIANPVATISVTTKFYLTVSGASACNSIDSVTITINPLPVVQTLGDTSICQNDLLVLTSTPGLSIYQWSPGRLVNDSTIASPTYTGNGSGTLIVTGTNGFGCFAKDTINVNVKPLPNVRSIPDSNICSFNPSIILTTTGAQTYSWSPAIFLSNPNIASPVFTGNQSQTYYVTGTAANGCKAKDTVNIVVNAPGLFQAPPDKTMCVNTSVQLDGNNGPAMEYLWSPATWLTNPTIINPVANPPATTVYSVTITNRGCNYDSTFNVTVNVVPKPIINARKSNDIDCSNRTAQLFASGGNNYTWSPSTGLSDPNIPNPVVSRLTATQKYVVSVSGGAGCDNTDSVTVFVKNLESLARFMPNAFTPNGDGLNDCYGLKNWMYIKKLEFRIFNRYGEQVFGTSDPNKCWDGKYKGKIADQGTYVFYIKAETSCGTEEQKGNFILAR